MASEDAISRKALYEALYEHFHDEDAPNNITEVTLGSVRNFVKDFPSVTPTSSKIEQVEDVISRKAVLDLAITITTDDHSGNEILGVVEVDDIKNLPPIQPKAKVGHWVREDDMITHCSECGQRIVSCQDWFEYCPKCGANMEVSE